MTELKRNVPGYIDERGVFRPIRKAAFVGSGRSRRRATVKDRKKYSRAKAGDLGKARQERALEDVFDREIRLQQESQIARERDLKKIEREFLGDQTESMPGQSLMQFVRSSGGIKPHYKFGGKANRGKRISYDAGELDRLKYGESGKRGLVSEKGKYHLDDMFKTVREAGFDVADPWDMIDKIEDEAKGGSPTYANFGYLDYRDNPVVGKSDLHIQQLGSRSFGVFLKTYLLKKFATKAAAEKHLRSIRAKAKSNPASAVRLAKAAISIFDNDLDLDVDAKDVARLKKGEKKNPVDAIGLFANAAVGIASALQIKDHMNRPKPRRRRKSNGTTQAKTKARRSNPVGSAPTSTRYHEREFDRSLSAIEEGNYRKSRTANMHGRLAGYSKAEVEWMVKRAKLAARLKTKMNPADLSKLAPELKTNGAFKRMLQRRKAASALKRELRLERALERTRAKKAKALKAAVANPKRQRRPRKKYVQIGRSSDIRHPLGPDRSKARAGLVKLGYSPAEIREILRPVGEKAVARSKKANPVGRIVGVSNGWTLVKPFADHGKTPYSIVSPEKREMATARTLAAGRKKLTALSSGKKANPAKVPRSRTFEMFQGRKVTTAKAMPVSRHAPKRLAQLGDLVELKLANGTVINPSSNRFKLCAANGKLWIAGGKFAKPNPKAKANEINPIADIVHVVYGTRKPHHGDNAYTHYIHKLGEESGKRPILAVDREGFPVIRGGNYKIEARGIVD